MIYKNTTIYGMLSYAESAWRDGRTALKLHVYHQVAAKIDTKVALFNGASHFLTWWFIPLRK